MDFNDTPEEAAFRKEVRTWLDANATRKSDDKQSFRARNDDPELLQKAKEWQDKKATAGYARLTWPKEFGGRGASPILQVIYQQEEANYLVPLGFFDIGLGMCIPTMMAYATPEQLKRWAEAAGGFEKLVNRAGTTWRNLPPARKTPGSTPEWTLLIREYPALVRRPVLVMADASVLVGFAAKSWESRIGSRE